MRYTKAAEIATASPVQVSELCGGKDQADSRRLPSGYTVPPGYCPLCLREAWLRIPARPCRAVGCALRTKRSRPGWCTAGAQLVQTDRRWIVPAVRVEVRATVSEVLHHPALSASEPLVRVRGLCARSPPTESPPLSALEPTGTDRTRQSPSPDGVSGLLHFPDSPGSSRQSPPRPVTTRPQTATQSATRADGARLASVVDAWPTLPEPILAAILALVRTAAGDSDRT